MTYTLHPVRTPKDENRWLDVARVLYANDPHWVCPLDLELRGIFNPAKNPVFERGEATRWYLTDAQGKLAGRIAAFVDRKRSAVFAQPTGGLGYFECVNDPAAAALLFDAGRDWLQARGMEAMDGPVNFGENDRFSGLLIEGFEPPSFGMNYNPPYYRDLFEGYGWGIFFEQTSSNLDVSKPLPERFYKAQQWVKDKGVEFRNPTPKTLEKFALDFREVYNESWREHEHFSEMSEAQAIRAAKSMRFFMIPRFMVFAYLRDEPVGALLSVPDLNQILRPLNGKLGPWQKLLFLYRKRNDYAWYRKRGLLNRVRIIVIGVKPKMRRFGLEAGLILNNIPDGIALGCTSVDLSWIGDFNPLMLSLMHSMGATPARKHATYRYMFDRSKPVVREKRVGQKD
ncbi:MAG: GNAT family N-acetyltransferase [Bacteroidia bacterium]|nr:GNAT family N-acetyltransferase [Bacteroidia bacterium]